MKMAVYKLKNLLANANNRENANEVLRGIYFPDHNLHTWLDKKNSTLHDGNGNIIYVGQYTVLTRVNNVTSMWLRVMWFPGSVDED